MKASALFCGLVCAASAGAQYFSAGWTPGQAVSDQPSVATASFDSAKPTSLPRGAAPSGSSFDINNILTSPPIASFLERFGINITERLDQARQRSKIWDERVPLITDDNFRDLIVNEKLTEEEERQRVWFMVISVTAARQEGISKFVDEVFDSAYNETQLAGDLPHIRWGRIDYLNVSIITTKWGIWQAPYLVVLKDRGKTLRFFKAHELRLQVEMLRGFLQTNGWEIRQPWASAYSPGGSREYLLDYLAFVIARVYAITTKVPSWLLFVFSGSIASLILGLLHKPSATPAVTSARSAPISPPTPVPSPGGAKRGAAKQRKNGKK